VCGECWHYLGVEQGKTAGLLLHCHCLLQNAHPTGFGVGQNRPAASILCMHQQQAT
jgi:hypothetical protein